MPTKLTGLANEWLHSITKEDSSIYEILWVDEDVPLSDFTSDDATRLAWKAFVEGYKVGYRDRGENKPLLPD